MSEHAPSPEHPDSHKFTSPIPDSPDLRESHEATVGGRDIFVEIGPGLTPSAPRPGSNPFTGNNYYVGVDAGRDSSTIEGHNYGEVAGAALPVLNRITKKQYPGQNVSFIAAEASDLPFADKSVKDVYMANVLTAPPKITDEQLNKLTEEQIQQIHREQQLQLLREIKRVLRPDGGLVVKCDWDMDLWPADTVKELLEEAGLRIDERIEAKPGNPYPLMVMNSRYGQRQLGIKGYFFRASKPESPEREKIADNPDLRWLAEGSHPTTGP
jgi:SAM-dependent methyltransferase